MVDWIPLACRQFEVSVMLTRSEGKGRALRTPLANPGVSFGSFPVHHQFPLGPISSASADKSPGEGDLEMSKARRLLRLGLRVAILSDLWLRMIGVLASEEATDGRQQVS